MKVTIDRFSGFCWGVVRTIEIAEQELAAGRQLYSLGDIIHNPMEIKRLGEKGLQTIQVKDLEGAKGGTVLIRAHGEPPSTYKKAVELGDPQGEAGTRLGFVLTADGPHANPAEAVEVLRAARLRSRDAAATLLHLALAHARAGNNAAAKTAAQGALDAPDATPSIRDQATRLLTHV